MEDLSSQGQGLRPGFRTRIIDRAGQALPLCDESALPAHAAASVRRAVARANRHRIRSLVKQALMMGGIYVVIFGGWDLLQGRSLGTSIRGVVPISFFFIVISLVTTLAAKAEIARSGRRALALCLRAGFCPSCAYELRGVAPAPDTFVRCPECGGTWPSSASVRSPI